MTPMALGPYAAFILAAYGAAALIVTAMVAWVVIDHRRQARWPTSKRAAWPGARIGRAR